LREKEGKEKESGRGEGRKDEKKKQLESASVEEREDDDCYEVGESEEREGEKLVLLFNSFLFVL